MFWDNYESQGTQKGYDPQNFYIGLGHRKCHLYINSMFFQALPKPYQPGFTYKHSGIFGQFLFMIIL